MVTFLLVLIALGLVLTTFAGGVLVGFLLKVPSRIERLRKMRDEMMQEIDDTVDYYVGLQERLSERRDETRG
jgi:MFS superfamily sulfate permease-like transporter